MPSLVCHLLVVVPLLVSNKQLFDWLEDLC